MAVRVLAEHAVGRGRIAAGRVIEIGRIGEEPVSPSRHDLPSVAFRHVDGRIRGNAHRREAEAGTRGLRRCRAHERAKPGGAQAHGGSAGSDRQHTEQAPAGDRRLDHAVEVGGFRARVTHLVEGVEGKVLEINLVGLFAIHAGSPEGLLDGNGAHRAVNAGCFF